MATREENETKFGHWTDHADGTRTYWYATGGKHGWYARYVKHVDVHDQTLSFRQEVYNENRELVEIHGKYPIDKGHQRVRE